MKKLLLLIMLLVVVACGKKSDKEVDLDYKWKEIEGKSKDGQVNIYKYGWAQEVNRYMD